MKMPDLGKQIGPLPLGAWLLVVSAGLGIAYYTRKSGNEEPIAVEDGSGVPGVGDGSVGGWVPTTPGGGGDDDEPSEYADNDAWGVAAVRLLIARGMNPTTADNAVRKYLSAEKLTFVENAMLQIALVALGPPPYPLPPAPDPGKPPDVVTPPTTTPKPKPKPAPKPATKYRYHTVKRGENLWNISIKYYKVPNYGKIYNANKSGKKRSDGKTGMIANPRVIQPGWVLLIP